MLITVRDVKELKGVINYDSDSSVIELKDFTFKDLDIDLFGFLFYDCKFTNCVIKNSNIFKFIILFVTACIYVYPLNIQHLINIVVCSILALVIFEGIRIYDKYVEEKEKENKKTN